MDLDFLAGEGEMARRTRAFDWAGTELGAPATWGATLRAMVRLALTTQHPIFIFWGAQLRCFYNDAYSASLGPEKHPGILGARALDAWPEIWDTIGPQIDLVMRGDGATWHENQLVPILRHGALQDVYWTYSYAPIDDAAAPHGVGGVLVICTETTQQVLAAKSAVAERERLSRMFEQAPGFMALLDGPQHRFALANPAYLRLVGNRDVLGRSVAEALPEAAAQGYVALLDEVYRSGRAHAAVGATYSQPVVDGAPPVEHQLDFVYQPITDAGGAVSGIFVEGTDVSARVAADAALRRSEAELRQREEQLRLAAEAADLGFWDVDLVSDTLFWPARVKAMFGISADVPVSMADFYAGLHPQDHEHTTASFAAATDPLQRATYEVEYRTVGKEDGLVRWVAAKGRGLFDEQGRCVRVLGTAMDISRRKAAELRLRELNETLEQRVAQALADRKLLADIVENADMLVLVLDMQGRVLAINRASAEAFERIDGVRPTVGDALFELLAERPPYRAEYEALWQRAFDGEDYTVVHELGDAARHRRHYEMRFCALRDPAGRQIGVYSFSYDVSQRVRDQQRLARAEAALRQTQKLEAIGRLTGGIAHDFNNVLQAMQGNLQLIARKPSDERVSRWAENAQASIHRGAALTAQLLTFAREQKLQLRPVAIDRLVTGLHDMLCGSLGPAVQLRLQLGAGQVAVWGDATQIEMALLNLAINARDAMPDGGTLQVQTRQCTVPEGGELESGEYVELAVRDSGCGMSAEVLARAFDPFFTTKSIGQGSGLGLSQVYGMALQVGGSAAIDSAPGQGTTVSLLLRCCDAQDAAAGTTTRPDAAALPPALRALVVDDEAQVRAALIDALELLGCRATGVGDGASALQALQTEVCDLMIIDFAMPGMNGAQLADAVRARHPAMPIIFISGYADTKAIEQVAGPAVPILRKPFDQAELHAALQRAAPR